MLALPCGSRSRTQSARGLRTTNFAHLIGTLGSRRQLVNRGQRRIQRPAAHTGQVRDAHRGRRRGGRRGRRRGEPGHDEALGLRDARAPVAPLAVGQGPRRGRRGRPLAPRALRRRPQGAYVPRGTPLQLGLPHAVVLGAVHKLPDAGSWHRSLSRRRGARDYHRAPEP